MRQNKKQQQEQTMGLEKAGQFFFFSSEKQVGYGDGG